MGSPPCSSRICTAISSEGDRCPSSRRPVNQPPEKHHLDYATPRARLPSLVPRRLVLTHLSVYMLAHHDIIEGNEVAENSKVIEI
jgi:phosphoribosyl 1,2-cyclic phosphodiesterase